MRSGIYSQLNSRLLGVLLFLIIALPSADAQSGWVSLDPGTTTENFKGVSFVDKDTGWAAGWDSKNLYNTIDGGHTWTHQSPGVLAYFEDISFVDAQNGLATGSDGAIIYTNNGGATWKTADYGLWLTYNACYQLDPDMGICAGSNTINQPFVGFTTDGFKTLSYMNFYFQKGSVGYEGRLNDVHMINKTVGFTVGRVWTGEGAICKTTDGSATPWTTILWTSYPLNGINFPSSQVGYAVGELGRVLKTTDGGLNWNLMPTGLSTTLTDVEFIDNNTGVVVGVGGLVLSTTDGGANWTTENSGVKVNLNDISIVDANTAFAAGHDGVIIGKGVVPLALTADKNAISASTGGVVNFALSAGSMNAGRSYLLFGGVTGTNPGTPLPGGAVVLPLNWDAVTNIIILNLNSPIFTNFLGALDNMGSAKAQFNMPPAPRPFVGTTFHFAYALANPFDFVSNAVAVVIAP